MRSRFHKDYKRMGAGDYRYVGKYYTLPMDANEKKRSGWINFGFAAGMILLELMAGMFPADSSKTMWIVIPYFILFLPTAYMVIGAGTYLGVPLRMENSAYENSVLRMKRSCMGVMLIASFNVILDLVFILIHMKTGLHLAVELIYLGCMILLIAIGVVYGLVYDRLYAGVQVE